MEYLPLVGWLLVSVSQTLWSLFLILAVATGLFSKNVREAFVNFVRVVNTTAWDAMHIHWHRKHSLDEINIGGSLAIRRELRCRCGSRKIRTVIL